MHTHKSRSLSSSSSPASAPATFGQSQQTEVRSDLQTDLLPVCLCIGRSFGLLIFSFFAVYFVVCKLFRLPAAGAKEARKAISLQSKQNAKMLQKR